MHTSEVFDGAAEGEAPPLLSYFRCWSKECGAVQMHSERLEEVFVELSTGFSSRLEWCAWSRLLCSNSGRELRKVSAQEAAGVKRRIADAGQRKKRLVKAYIYNQAIDRATYDDELAALEEALTFTPMDSGTRAMEGSDHPRGLRPARRPGPGGVVGSP